MTSGYRLTILLLGSGGREHALAWKLAQSPRLRTLYTLPGNPGTAQHGLNLPGDQLDPDAVVQVAGEHAVDQVVIGPEAPLANGVSDALRATGIPVFGPSQAAAQIEASKAFAKAFMQRHGIPTAAAQVFDDYAAARAYLQNCAPSDIVLKASGLAAGKGVFLPQTRDEAEDWLQAVMEAGCFGAAGAQVVIEERLHGPEVSVLAFCDGHMLAVMPPVQDHKRLLDGDRGPNTGGMGTFAPSPLCPPDLLKAIVRDILQPTVDGLRAEGRPFVGVLYAGLMLTPRGPRVLEFNCRFGDPETQVILPLLESDLLDVVQACAEGRLEEVRAGIRWREAAAVCVVLASQGYPAAYSKGYPISGLESLPKGVLAFHAGTRQTPRGLVTHGGRVLGITALGDSLGTAHERAYEGVRQVRFEGMHYRTDIWRGGASAYAAAGVDIESGNRAVALMKQSVRSTFTPEVLSDVGAFGGLFSAAILQEMREPVLVATTDGVGTKVALAAQAGRFRVIGRDIVNHCVNDILVQGARPLFFLDYIASGKLKLEMMVEVVRGVAQACRENGCALLGGETAEMPGVYVAEHLDVAGTLVGVVERQSVLPRDSIRPSDVLVGLASSGPHTNGYSLIRRIFADVPLDTVYPELGVRLADALLAVHRSYLAVLMPVLEQAYAPKALVHITGGGFFDNLPRVLPPDCGVRLRRWPLPPIFALIQCLGSVETTEMYRVFNMGIGMVAILASEHVDAFRAAVPEETWVIGEVSDAPGVVLEG